MTEIVVVRTLGGLAPSDDFARGVLKRWPIGSELKADVRKPRAKRSLNRYWLLCQLVLENSTLFKTKDQVHQFLKIRSGHVLLIASKATGEVFQVADSIAYEEMEDETQFQDFWDRVVQIVAEDILGTGIPDIELEIQKLVGFAR